MFKMAEIPPNVIYSNFKMHGCHWMTLSMKDAIILFFLLPYYLILLLVTVQEIVSSDKMGSRVQCCLDSAFLPLASRTIRGTTSSL